MRCFFQSHFIFVFFKKMVISKRIMIKRINKNSNYNVKYLETYFFLIICILFVYVSLTCEINATGNFIINEIWLSSSIKFPIANVWKAWMKPLLIGLCFSVHLYYWKRSWWANVFSARQLDHRYEKSDTKVF